jgi:hypothetical protein
VKGVFLYAHGPSDGAKALCDALKIKRIKNEGSRFKGSPNRTVIVWGASEVSREVNRCQVINNPLICSAVINKLLFFDSLKDTDCRTVPHTEDANVAKEWIRDGSTVCARLKLRASGGDGLVLFDGLDPFPVAPLYTKYVKKRDEFRIHVLKGEVISVQRKAVKRLEEGQEHPPGRDVRIRNLSNGYIFARNDVVVPDDVKLQALNVFKHIDLDFGAVDVIYNQKQGQAYVLEVNTAPGLEGTTVTDYAEAFKRFLTPNA